MIVFDLDGTLVDSQPEIAKALRAAWAEVLGPSEPFPNERFRVGPPLVDTVAMLAPAASDEQRDSIVRAFRVRYDASDFSSTLPYPGIVDALAELAGRGARLAVATNKRRAPTLAILRRWFDGRFARVACVDGTFPDAEGEARAWSKAEMVRWCEGTVMVGDTDADVAAARANGIRAIAVTWGYGDEEALRAAGADELVRDVPGLLRALRLA